MGRKAWYFARDSATVVFRRARQRHGRRRRPRNIYVGNLASEVTEDDLRTVFAPFGEVTTVTVIRDRLSGISRGFGFVEMPDGTAARAAIAGLQGRALQGLTLNVNEARPRDDRRGGGRPRDDRRRSW